MYNEIKSQLQKQCKTLLNILYVYLQLTMFSSDWRESGSWGGWTMKSVHVRVQGGYCFWEEAVFESICFSPDEPVAPPWGQQVKQFKQGKVRVGAVFGDGFGSAGAAGGVNVHQGGESAANDLLCCLYNSLEPLPVCNGADAIPYCDTVCQQALNRWAVEGQQQVGV